MRTLVFTDPLLLSHDPGPGHPEAPGRLSRALGMLTERPLEGVQLRAPRPATHEELTRIHPAAHLLRLGQIEGRSVRLDVDTFTSPRSWEAALLAAGSGVSAVEAVLSGDADNAFALVRPPGHHAEPGRAMGACLLNNIAIAAAAARARGVERVLVLDFDVHHGNGTQAALWRRKDVLYQSVHQAPPYYPGSGEATEHGGEGGEYHTVNLPLPPGAHDADYRAAFEDLLLPIARAYRPQLVLVSAGYDAHEEDPIGEMVLTERAYAGMSSAIVEFTREVCGGRAVFFLEGGYAPEATARCVHATLEVLSGGRRDDFGAGGVSAAVARALRESRAVHRLAWGL